MKLIKFLAVVFLTTIVSSCNSQGVTKKSLDTEIDSLSYAIGMDVARNVQTNVSEMNKDLFLQGFNNVMDSTNLLIEKEQVQEILSAYFKKKQEAEKETGRDYMYYTKKAFVVENLIRSRLGFVPEKVTENYLVRYMEKVKNDKKTIKSLYLNTFNFAINKQSYNFIML